MVKSVSKSERKIKYNPVVVTDEMYDYLCYMKEQVSMFTGSKQPSFTMAIHALNGDYPEIPDYVFSREYFRSNRWKIPTQEEIREHAMLMIRKQHGEKRSL